MTPPLFPSPLIFPRPVNRCEWHMETPYREWILGDVERNPVGYFFEFPMFFFFSSKLTQVAF